MSKSSELQDKMGEAEEIAIIIFECGNEKAEEGRERTFSFKE